MSEIKKLKVIITGATGMVGEGVMHECLLHPMVESVLVINRRPSGFVHGKLKEIIHPDFSDISPIADQLVGYNACFFCSGVSSVGKTEEEYFKVTYTLTLSFAGILVKHNPDMVFEYISGASTDTTEKGRIMWARVKGKTENDLMKLPFTKVYNYRPGYMHPTPGQKNIVGYYKYITWLYPVLKVLFPNQVSTMKQLGLAMINGVLYGYGKQILEVPDIKLLAEQA